MPYHASISEQHRAAGNAHSAVVMQLRHDLDPDKHHTGLNIKGPRNYYASDTCHIVIERVAKWAAWLSQLPVPDAISFDRQANVSLHYGRVRLFELRGSRDEEFTPEWCMIVMSASGNSRIAGTARVPHQLEYLRELLPRVARLDPQWQQMPPAREWLCKDDETMDPAVRPVNTANLSDLLRQLAGHMEGNELDEHDGWASKHRQAPPSSKPFKWVRDRIDRPKWLQLLPLPHMVALVCASANQMVRLQWMTNDTWFQPMVALTESQCGRYWTICGVDSVGGLVGPAKHVHSDSGLRGSDVLALLQQLKQEVAPWPLAPATDAVLPAPLLSTIVPAVVPTGTYQWLMDFLQEKVKEEGKATLALYHRAAHTFRSATWLDQLPLPHSVRGWQSLFGGGSLEFHMDPKGHIQLHAGIADVGDMGRRTWVLRAYNVSGYCYRPLRYQMDNDELIALNVPRLAKAIWMARDLRRMAIEPALEAAERGDYHDHLGLLLMEATTQYKRVWNQDPFDSIVKPRYTNYMERMCALIKMGAPVPTSLSLLPFFEPTATYGSRFQLRDCRPAECAADAPGTVELHAGRDMWSARLLETYELPADAAKLQAKIKQLT